MSQGREGTGHLASEALGGQKAVPNASASSNSTSAAGNVWKAIRLQMQVISPWARNATAAGHRIALQSIPASSPGQGSTEPAGSLTGDERSHRLAQMSNECFPLTAASALAHICSHLPGGPGRPRQRACRHALGIQARGRGTAHLLFVFGVVSIAARILVLLPVFAMLAGGQEDNILSVMDVI